MNQKDVLVCLDRLIRISFYILILCLPVSISLVESFSGFVILFFIIKRCMLKDFNIFFSPRHFLNLSMTAFMGAIVCSVIFSQFHYLSIVGFIGKIAQGFLLFVSFIEAFTQIRYINHFIFVWFISAFIVALSGLSQYFFGIEFLRFNSLVEGRVSSSLRHPNDLGAYIATVCTLLFVILQNWKSFCLQLEQNKRFSWLTPIVIRMFFGIVFVALLVCLGLTFSRASWIAFFAAIIMAGLYKRKNLLIVFLVIMGFIVLFMPVMIKIRDVSLITDNVRDQREGFSKVGFIEPRDLGALRENIDQVFEQLIKEGYINQEGMVLAKTKDLTSPAELILNDLDLKQKEIIFGALRQSDYWQTLLTHTVKRIGKGRWEFWKEAIGIMYDYPFFGSGLNTYSRIGHTHKLAWGGYPHNSYLQMAAETGLVGLAGFLWVLGAFFKTSLHSIRTMTTGTSRIIYIGTIAGFFAYLVQSFFDTTFYSVQLSVLLWIMVAMGVALQRLPTDPKSIN